MKNTAKNKSANAPIPELITADSNTKPISGSYATAVQLANLLGLADLDETFLRNRVADGVIPKPDHSQYEIIPTLAGLTRWYRSKAAARDGLPASFDSMQAMENSYLRTPKEFTKWTLKNGGAAAQLGGSRIDPRPVLEKAAEILRLIPTGRLAGIEGLETVNTNTELGLKIREEREALQRKALLEKGEMLLSRDGDYALSRLVVEELLEKYQGPFRTALTALPKALKRQHKNIHAVEGPLADKLRKFENLTDQAFAALLDKMRAKIPAEKPTEENPEA